jgi:hypothetical protein
MKEGAMKVGDKVKVVNLSPFAANYQDFKGKIGIVSKIRDFTFVVDFEEEAGIFYPSELVLIEEYNG